MHLEDLDEGPAWGAEFLCEDMGLRRCFASWHSVFHATLGTEAVSAFKAGLSPHFGEGKMGWELRGERIPAFFFFLYYVICMSSIDGHTCCSLRTI